jgi:hypothetical protein
MNIRAWWTDFRWRVSAAIRAAAKAYSDPTWLELQEIGALRLSNGSYTFSRTAPKHTVIATFKSGKKRVLVDGQVPGNVARTAFIYGRDDDNIIAVERYVNNKLEDQWP